MSTADLSAIAATHSSDPVVQGAILAALIQAQANVPASAPTRKAKGKLTGAALKAAQDRAAHARASKGASKPARKPKADSKPVVKAAPVKDSGYDYWASKGAGKRQRAAINAQEKRLGYKLSDKALFASMTKLDARNLLIALKAEVA